MVRFYTPSLYGACDALDAFDEYDIEYEEV